MLHQVSCILFYFPPLFQAAEHTYLDFFSLPYIVLLQVLAGEVGVADSLQRAVAAGREDACM